MIGRRSKFQSKDDRPYTGKSKKVEGEVLILKNQLARVLADYDNLRKRVDEEKETWIKFSTERVLLKVLPILDALESAQLHLRDQGLGIVIEEFKKILREEEIEEVRPKPEDKFDIGLHEAVESIESDKKGLIAEVVLPGWKFKDLPAQTGGKVIRFAKVKVYGGKIDKRQDLEKERN